MISMKNIKNLEDLRKAKQELKTQIAKNDANTKKNFLYNSVNKLFSTVETKTNHSLVGSGVNGTLHYLSKKASHKMHLGKTGQTILSLAIIVATPIIAKKIQHFIDKKL